MGILFYIDVEDTVFQRKAGRKAVTDAIKGFCETLKDKEFYVCVYTNLNRIVHYMNYHEIKNKYDFWIAFWNDIEPSRKQYCYGMWQFGGEVNRVRLNQIAEYLRSGLCI